MTPFTNPIRGLSSAPTERSQASRRSRLVSSVLVAIGVLAFFGALGYLLPALGAPIGPQGIPEHISTDAKYLPYYAMRSVLRMFLALFVSLVFSYIYGLAAARSKRARAILMPLLDILQSVPILGFLSATISIWLVLFPGSIMGVEAASIFAIFTSQAWNMTFSFYGSLLNEPTELDEAARSLRLTRWQRFWKLDVPYSMIPMLWNCMMSVGGGWFFLTASEMISVNNRTMALPGIGSYVEEAAGQKELGKVGLAIVTMVVVVLLIDFLLWKPLTAWAEKFRMADSESTEPKRSIVLTVLRLSGISDLLGRIGRPISGFLDRLTRPLGVTGGHWSTGQYRRRTLFSNGLYAVVLGLLGAWGLFKLYQLVVPALGFSEVGHVFVLGFLTMLRVTLLIIVSSAIWVPIGAMIGLNPKLSRILQPVVQICASFPANFIFPFVTMWFLAWHIDINWGSILLMALGTQWYILFNVIAGASAIPDDLREMSRSLRQPAWQRWKTLILPGVFNSWCTGGITASGGAWNASIVSEVVSYAKHTLTATGVGSYVAEATAVGDTPRIIAGVAVMSVFVVALNKVCWSPIQALAQRRYAIT
ncbi:ABC transporter permease [Bifidobacterium actinocoloniiforme DSM 22766]|uniref:ABC transporter permease n=1 Tax=Bifidobacterium actinocoloniiforme DSM 22766 TaxID=1437605 RepID=A0A086Z007_9BIFI|nr:ABC transporter permease subunit [Bifidobacterium actinocoloniiforme]AKV55127.1 sulfonate ABC transporter permease [Bifidobacterium actinocoloniiforme DSM 22766]KFI39857.1 ABC transporter permease [Bifidobacterium actinocoloniiforme DSM 22766]